MWVQAGRSGSADGYRSTISAARAKDCERVFGLTDVVVDLALETEHRHEDRLVARSGLHARFES